MLAMRPGQRSQRGRQDPFARPLDHALERLRAHGLPYRADPTRFDTWHAVCVFCRVGAWTLTLRERGVGGEINLRCAAGCSDGEIRQVLERHPADAQIEAAEAGTAEAWAITAQMREIAGRALELAVDAQRELSQLKGSCEAVPA
jgi:hypothetical protein